MHRLGKDFYGRSTEEVAFQLLGQRIVLDAPVGRMTGRIVEVEAYLAKNDPACHAARGITPRNKSMFGPPGLLYVYSLHTRYCMNVVTEDSGIGAAVLIRAMEPEQGIEAMLQNRPVQSPRELSNGPGKLCQALGIDRTYDGEDLLVSHRMWIEFVEHLPQSKIRTTSRIGISQARDLQLRYFVDGHQFVSGRACDHSIPRKWTWQRIP